ncbi:MAG: MFS transporter [Candidatus Omnitrophica bacterium]|nr:MFS transporter [Candidatus Omnitrophota bacterium]
MFNIIILGITSFLTDISSEMIYPVLPVYLITVLGASPAILGLIEGVAESASSLLKVFSGYFSDKFKQRKPLTIIGYFGSVVGKFLIYLAVSWPYFFVGRIADRFGKGIRTAPRDALIAESAKPGKKGAAFGLHRAMDTLGAVVGVLIAYYFVLNFKSNLKNLFLWSLIPGFFGVFFLFFVKERTRQPEALKQKPQFKWGSLDKRLKLFFIFTFIFTLGNSSNQFLLLRAKNLGNPLYLVILFYLVFNITYALSSYPAARLSDKIGRKKILVAGYFFYGLVYLGFAINASVGNFWLLFGLYGLYMGFTDGVEKALVSDISSPDLRATTLGVHAMLVGIGLFPASLLAGLLWKFVGPSAPFYFGALMGIVSSCGLWFILKGL